MELPGILKRLMSTNSSGFIELCPDEYDMGNLSELIEEALAECEALTLSGTRSATGAEAASE